MKYEIRKEQEVNIVTLAGPIDAEVTALFSEIVRSSTANEVLLDCAGIGRVNSIGIKSWILGLDALAATRRISMSRCPLSLLEVAAMIPSFFGRHDIKSLYVNFLCTACAHESLLLVPIQDRQPQMPVDLKCPKCQGPQVCDEDTAEQLSLVFTTSKRPDQNA